MTSEFVLSKEYLETLYISERKSTREIAKIFGVSQTRIMKLLIEFNIPRRSHKENPIPTRGKPLSIEHKAKISAATLGRVILNPETGRGYRWAKTEVKCSSCQKPLLKKPCHINKANQYFCSTSCQSKLLKGKDKGGKVKVFCTECSQPLIRFRWTNKEGKRFFCNQKCAGIWKQKHLTGDKIYNYKGGYDQWEDYGPSWRSARRQALDRDNHACRVCGVTKEALGKEPDVHHVVPFRLIGKERHEKANRLSNLICLCPTHHSEAESQDNKLAEHYANIVRNIHIIL